MRIASVCGLLTLSVVGAAQAEPGADGSRLSAVVSAGVAQPPFGWGLGAEVGYTWSPGLYVGGESVYHFGGDGIFGGASEGSGDRPRSLFALGGVFGFELPPLLGAVLRPSFDCGVGSLDQTSPYVGGALTELVRLDVVELGLSVKVHDYLIARDENTSARGVTTAALYLFIGAGIP